jgi:WS/DGAT/MGAT family acyltransferase
MAIRLMKPNDAVWLYIEGPDTPVHVAGLMICRLPKGAPPDFVGDLVSRWRERKTFKPPFNYRWRPNPFPAWEELGDDEIDLEYHLRHSALPAPGGERELGVLVSRLHSHRLHRAYPLWEVHLIEGLQNKRFALYMKLHHSQVDGVGGIRMLERMLADSPKDVDHDPPWAIGVGGARPAESDGAAPARDGGGGPAGLLSRLAGGVMDQVRAVPGVAGVASDLVVEAINHEHPETAVPFEAPMTVLNKRIHGPRRFATQHYELDRVKAVAKKAGATINDVFVAICAGALRRYLKELGELPEQSLIAALPVSVRPAGDAAVGNAITFIHTKLYTDIADPEDRLAAIHESAQDAKQRLQQLPRTGMDNYTLLVMGPYLAQLALGLGGYTRPMHNLVISNVPGPSTPFYLGGARVSELYPVSLLFNGQALNISVVSFGGYFNLGFTGARDTLPSMQRLAVYTGEELEELEATLGTTPIGRARAAGKS